MTVAIQALSRRHTSHDLIDLIAVALQHLHTKLQPLVFSHKKKNDSFLPTYSTTQRGFLITRVAVVLDDFGADN